MPTGIGLRPGCESAGLATDPLPATRLPSTLLPFPFRVAWLLQTPIVADFRNGMRFRRRGYVLPFGTVVALRCGRRELVLVRQEPGRSCAEPASRPSAPRSGGGAERRALTAASTRA